MLNSYCKSVSKPFLFPGATVATSSLLPMRTGIPITRQLRAPYLLNGHHNLHGIQAVQAEVVREVGSLCDLLRGKSSC